MSMSTQGPWPLTPRTDDCEQRHSMTWHDFLPYLPGATSLCGRKFMTWEYSPEGSKGICVWVKDLIPLVLK